MDRVVVSRPFCGICGMQVCAVEDATDKEILEVCNTQNPSGTSNGWSSVIREVDEERGITTEQLPIQCEDYPGRKHFLVLC